MAYKKPPKNPVCTVCRKGKGDRPHKEPTCAPAWRAGRISHQAQGSKMALAPRMRASAMSMGSNPRDAEARAMTMKPVQMSTVMTAEARPTVFEENRMARIIRGRCTGASGAPF
jgi:hypothetical protein